jgi:hypothetical protein
LETILSATVVAPPGEQSDAHRIAPGRQSIAVML